MQMRTRKDDLARSTPPGKKRFGGGGLARRAAGLGLLSQAQFSLEEKAGAL